MTYNRQLTGYRYADCCVYSSNDDVLKEICLLYTSYTDILMGGCSIDATGVPLTDEAIATALDSDAVLMGSIGGNTATSPWYKLAPELRPEAGLLKLRKSLNLFANLRPAYLLSLIHI